MKKLVSLFVAMAFAIGVAGCGNNNEHAHVRKCKLFVKTPA